MPIKMNAKAKSATAVLVFIGLMIAGWFGIHWWRQLPRSKEEVLRSIDSDLAGAAKKGFGGSLLLASAGNVVLSKGYGMADESRARLITSQTGFDIGSLVKPFTAAAILKLESQGRLHVNDTLGAYFPNVPSDKSRITIDQLLSHSSGLPDIVDASLHPVEYSPDFDYEPVTRDEIVRRALHAALIFRPGEKSEYSNLGYSLLGVVIEKASGKGYEQYVFESIFKPAGMTRTGYKLPEWKSGELAVGYYKGKAWGTPVDHPWLSDGPSWNLRANGGMLSTVLDLYKWIQALERGDILDGRAKEHFDSLFFHRNQRGARTMGAAGSNEVFDACYLWYVDEKRVLIMLTNNDQYRAEKVIPDLAREMRRIRP